MERARILQELALQIEGELARGILCWPEPEWNEALRRFLAPPARPAAPHRPAPSSEPATFARRRPPAAEPTGTASRRLPTAATAPRAPKEHPTFPPPPEATGRDPDWEKQLADLKREAEACTRCPLHETRTNVVFNSGSGKVPLVFISEAPGANEDAQAEAFVGRAGQLLTKIIAAIGIDRQDVYICNVLKCRPPANRNPLPVEIETCSPYLFKQLEILKPRVICTLGLFATQLLLESKAPIGKLRGRVFRYHDTPLLPTYHPAALLRNPGLKRTVWEDVQLLRKLLDEGMAAVAKDVVAAERPAPRPQVASRNLFGAQ